MRTALLAVCGFTVLACGWLALMEGVLRHSGYASRMALDSLLVAGSLATGAVVLLRAGNGWRWLALAAGIGAGAVGAAAVARDLRAAHFEGFVVLIGAALLAQATLTIGLLAFRWSRKPA